MQELAWTGAKVLKAEAVEFASTNGVPIVVRSTFENGHDTWVHPHPDSAQTFRPRRAEVAGVSGRKDVIRITFKSSGVRECSCGTLQIANQSKLLRHVVKASSYQCVLFATTI